VKTARKLFNRFTVSYIELDTVNAGIIALGTTANPSSPRCEGIENDFDGHAV
jgi:hypothetical protein